MTTPIDVAVQRLSDLRAEIADLETFIRVYYKLYPAEKLSAVLPDGPKFTEKSLAEAPDALPVDTPVYKPVENSGGIQPVPPHSRARAVDTSFKIKGARDIFGDLFEQVIREAGRPLVRGDIIKAVEAKPDAPPLNSEDAAKYVGTLLWRNRNRFRNLPGYGYWLKDRPYPPAGYDPAADNEGDAALDAEVDTIEPPELPIKLNADVAKTYDAAVREVRDCRELGFEENDYLNSLQIARHIEKHFPEVMGKEQKSLVDV